MEGASPTILDPCCGSRMFWFDRADDRTLFGDIRSEERILCDGRLLQVLPDMEMDFRSLPFEDGRFKLVVFDPPHLRKAGDDSWLRAKYGCLNPDTWTEDLRAGFSECFRVLEREGVLVFKWNETQIKVRDVLALTDHKPLFGHPSGKRGGTHWICFMKGAR